MTIIEWTGENGVSYNVTTLPDIPIAFIGDTSVRVIIPHDTQFMVNVSALLCEEEVTTIENFFYGKSENIDIFFILHACQYLHVYC